MKLPTQAKPVAHVASVQVGANGVAPSGSCGCPNTCIGLCLFGSCQGLCV